MNPAAGSDRSRLDLRVRGRVQGVAFRWHTRQQARRLGLTGRVRNQADGSVTIVAEGETAALEALLAWALSGPDLARVESSEVNWGRADGSFSEFLIAG